MKRGYNSKRSYRVRTKHGLIGWRTRLRNNYLNFDEWLCYSFMYGLSEKLGFRHAIEAWDENPVIEGSPDPRDFRKILIKNMTATAIIKYKNKTGEIFERSFGCHSEKDNAETLKNHFTQWFPNCIFISVEIIPDN